MNTILNRIRALPVSSKLIYAAFLSVFLPFPVTGLAIVAIGLYLLIVRKTRKELFVYRGRYLLIVFTVYTAIVALFSQNYIGAACSLGFFLMIIISYYARSAMTPQMFEKAVDICCFASLPVSFLACVERLLHLRDPLYRCQVWFFNTNYLSTLMATVIILCAYKVITDRNRSWRYYLTAVSCAVAVYLCGSMFAYVEIFVGVCILLFLNRKHSMLAICLIFASVCFVILYCVPEIFPRLSESNITTDNRIQIWNTSMEFIKDSPLFGHGFLTYFHMAAEEPLAYPTTHAHNIALEFILSFGFVGTILLLIFVWTYFEKVVECKELLREHHTTGLILSISAAVLIHSTTDMTLLWLQTGLLYLLIIAGIGIDERALNKRIAACLTKTDTFSREE